MGHVNGLEVIKRPQTADSSSKRHGTNGNGDMTTSTTGAHPGVNGGRPVGNQGTMCFGCWSAGRTHAPLSSQHRTNSPVKTAYNALFMILSRDCFSSLPLITPLVLCFGCWSVGRANAPLSSPLSTASLSHSHHTHPPVNTSCQDPL